jgi:hypothetical protein
MGKPTENEWNAFYIAFANVMREWVSLENVFALLLTSFLQTDQFRARIVWNAMPNWRARRELLSRLGETYIDEEALPAWRKLMKRAKTLGENRNKLAHLSTGLDPESGKVVMMGDAADSEYGFIFLAREDLDLNNIAGWPTAINKLTLDLMTLNAKLHTSSKMHRALQSDPSLNIGRQRPAIRGAPKPPPQS